MFRIMRTIHERVDGVQGVVVATRDGLTVASTAGDGKEDRIAAMAASAISLAQQTLAGSGGGDGQTVIRGDHGCLVVQGAGPAAVLAVKTGARPNMGLVQVEVPRAAAELESILG